MNDYYKMAFGLCVHHQFGTNCLQTKAKDSISVKLVNPETQVEISFNRVALLHNGYGWIETLCASSKQVFERLSKTCFREKGKTLPLPIHIHT